MNLLTRRSTGLLLVLMIALASCVRHQSGSNVDARREALRARLTQGSSSRRVYPYSLIPGGVGSEEEFRWHRRTDPALRAHYGEIGESLLRIAVPGDRWMFASYRLDNEIYWTRHPVLLHAGESVWSDGVHLVRGRCGNRLSETPKTPTRQFEPPDVATDTPLVIPEIPLSPPLAPIPGKPIPLPALTPPAPRTFVRVLPQRPGPTPQPPLAPAPAGTELFPPSTLPPGVLLPPPRNWTPPARPIAGVPEPGTSGLMICGILIGGLGAVLRRIFTQVRKAQKVNAG